MEEAYNLRDLADRLAAAFPQVEALYLFGSRRYRTGSPRSDVDVLVQLTHGTRIRPQELRAFSATECPALDLFLVDAGKAVSCANESCVQAESLPVLIARLEAVRFWTRAEGPLDADIDWKFRVPLAVDFPQTALITNEPIPGRWLRSLRAHFKEVEAAGLSVRPYVGSTSLEVATFLVDLLRRLVAAGSDLSPRGHGWSIHIETECDFQNLFYLAFKPWFPGLAREEITIRYDGQDKTADFNLFGNQIIVEIKHIRDAGTKAAVAKTLSGLGTFYSQHPNVRVLVFAVLVRKDVDLDDAKWESDFSYCAKQPQVWTRIYREQ